MEENIMRKRISRSDDSDSDLDVRRSSSKQVKSQATSSGMRSGLVHGHGVREMLEESRIARERELGESGANQSTSTVHRIEGRVVSAQEWSESQLKQDPRYRRERQRELDREFDKAQNTSWKQGIHQSEERRKRAEEALAIASEPIGQTRHREEIDNELKQKPRWDDPLAVCTTSSSKPVVCPYSAPANRFNIPPGYRWDGVVRGNDYEQRWFERVNERKDLDSRLYKFSSDL